MIVLYDVASPDVVGHVILDHVSLIPQYSEMHHREVVHGTRFINHVFPDANGNMHGGC